MRMAIRCMRSLRWLASGSLCLALLDTGCSSDSGGRARTQTPAQASVSAIVMPRPAGGCPSAMREVDGRCAVCEAPSDCEAHCRAGEGESCSLAALFYESGRFGAARKGEAELLYERGCSLGSSDSCEGLAGCLASGKACRADRRRAREIRNRLCTGGHPGACLANATVELEENHDAIAATRLAERGCLLGDADACALFGRHCLSADSAGTGCSREVFARGCELGRTELCARMTQPSEGRKIEP